jgi:inosine/xanthosine triphosphatase
MLIAVASRRKPKIEAVTSTVKKIKKFLTNGNIEYSFHEVESGVSETPLSVEELMLGAYQRVKNLQKIVKADFYIGMEGGIHCLNFHNEKFYFLQSWVYVSDGSKGYFGSSGNLQIPEKLKGMIIDRGMGLGDAIDIFSSKFNVRDNEGAFGVLTKNFISRSNAFEIALLNAFAPFYNREMYKSNI